MDLSIYDNYKVLYPVKYDVDVFGETVLISPGETVNFRLKGGYDLN